MTPLSVIWPNIPMGTPCTSNSRSLLLCVLLLRPVASASKLPAAEHLAVCGRVPELLPYSLPPRRVSGFLKPTSSSPLMLLTPSTPKRPLQLLNSTPSLTILAASMVTGPAKAPPIRLVDRPRMSRIAIVSYPSPPRRTPTPKISDSLPNS